MEYVTTNSDGKQNQVSRDTKTPIQHYAKFTKIYNNKVLKCISITTFNNHLHYLVTSL